MILKLAIIVAVVLIFLWVRMKRARRDSTADGLMMALNSEYLARQRTRFKTKPYKGEWWV